MALSFRILVNQWENGNCRELGKALIVQGSKKEDVRGYGLQKHKGNWTLWFKVSGKENGHYSSGTHERKCVLGPKVRYFIFVLKYCCTNILNIRKLWKAENNRSYSIQNWQSLKFSGQIQTLTAITRKCVFLVFKMCHLHNPW